MNIVELFKFPSLFINQFYPRPGTPAARMKRIDTAIVSGSTVYVYIDHMFINSECHPLRYRNRLVSIQTTN